MCDTNSPRLTKKIGMCILQKVKGGGKGRSMLSHVFVRYGGPLKVHCHTLPFVVICDDIYD